jgi:peptidoglycan/xylan/chitin deacetylase (PgdA/CDA1 family)
MYGFRTALYGTLLPAPLMGERGRAVVRRARDEGHEVGIHAWDHVRWQDRLDSLSRAVIREDYERAFETYEKFLGCPPECTASPAWLASDVSLSIEETFPFRYGSDARGRGPFRPLVDGRVLTVPQIPATLPTFDEVLGRDGATADDFSRQVVAGLVPGAGSVITVHAEAEGRAYLRDFEILLERVASAGWRLGPLSQLLPAHRERLPVCPVGCGLIRGRAGTVSIQGREVSVEAGG